MLLCFALQVALFILNVKSTNLANTVSFRPANTNSTLFYTSCLLPPVLLYEHLKLNLHHVLCCPAAAVAVSLCQQPVSVHRVALLLYHSLASAAEQLLSLALSQWAAVMAAELDLLQSHNQERLTLSSAN